MLIGFPALNAELERIRLEQAKRHEIGITQAALTLQAESQKICPVDKGLLRNSAYTRIEGSGFNTVAEIGYSQSYAIYVHENLEAHHKPPGQAKFLEEPSRTKRPEIVAAYIRAMGGR